MDPWEAVKWIAIFRLILPEALFRLCGGRVENLGELQPLAVKAGLNGVMMGNFLTTLGSEPEDDRAMFEELGLNMARQHDNGANPRPDNRSGWLDGETPRTPIDGLVDRRTRRTSGTPRRSSATAKKTSVPPRPDGAPRTRSPRSCRCERRGGVSMNDIEERLDDIRDARALPQAALISGPQGPRVLLDGRPVLLLCSNNYLGLADHPRVREAAAEAAMRWGAGAGASRLVSGNMTIHRRLEEQLADVQGHRGAACCSARATWPTPASSRRSRARATSSSPTRSTTPRSSTAAGCRGPRRSSTTTATWTTSSGACAQAEGRGALIVTDGVFSMDGDIAPLPEIVELAQRYDARVMVDEAHGIGASGRAAAGSVAEPGSRTRSTWSSGRSARRSAPTAPTCCCDTPMAKYLINTARTLIFSTALPPPAVAAAHGRARAAARAARAGSRSSSATRRVLREALTPSGHAGRGRRDARSCR